jgi:DNA-binding transcriptional regulator YiaG
MTRHERIKQLRKDAGLSISRAARLLSVNDRTLTRWESGDRRMPDAVLELLCIKVGADYSQFWDDEGGG